MQLTLRHSYVGKEPPPLTKQQGALRGKNAKPKFMFELNTWCFTRTNVTTANCVKEQCILSDMYEGHTESREQQFFVK